VIALPRNNGKARRNRRYYDAVGRQKALVDRCYADPRRTYMPADVDEFLRPGDNADNIASTGEVFE
jgi:hypothetical protein